MGIQPRSTTTPRWLIEGAFVVLLLLVFVGLTPFEVPPTGAAALAAPTGHGDALRQLLYVSTFVLLALEAYRRRSLSAVSIMPLSFVALIGWCFLSVAWSFAPDVSLRRAGLEMIVITSAILGVDAVGPKRSLELLRAVLIGVLVVNWISIPLIRQAVHLPGEADPGLVGDWRGLYIHKNIAGAVCTITALIELHFMITRKSWRDFAILVATLGFLAMTRSKTSMGFLPMAAAMGAIYGFGWKRDIDRWIVTIGAILACVLLTTIVLANSLTIQRKLDDPSAFTGRSAIWMAELGYIADHPWAGAGYGTFADTGKTSPLADYVDSHWVDHVSHGHNGYLQVTVTTGLIGFGLTMLALVILPLIGFWRRRPGEDLAFKALLFGLFVFAVLHNLLESDYLEGAGPVWFTQLIVIAMLRGSHDDPAAQRDADA
jgi:O-antigen ligase